MNAKSVELFVSSFGASIGKKSERVVIRQRGKADQEIALRQVRQITVEGRGVAVSSDLVASCARQGIPITFLSSIGEPLARIGSPGETGAVITRHEQVKAYDDQRGLQIAVEMVSSKMFNQAKLIGYFTRGSSRSDHEEELRTLIGGIIQRIEALQQIKGENVDQARELIMSAEAAAALSYWRAVGLLLAGGLPFAARKHRGATDPVNVMLNYGYGILYHQA